MGIGKNNDFKSKTVEYSTPKNFFAPIQKEFDITLDVCATAENSKCKKFYTINDNALTKEWNGNCWMNPPFNRQLKKWVEKAYTESLKGNTIVCLIPVRSNTKWWNEFVMKGEIRFIQGEMKFDGFDRGLWMGLCVVIFGRDVQKLGNSIIQETTPKHHTAKACDA